MIDVTNEELKKISLDILLDFHRVCKENNIIYSIGYGTLLGAVRHQGFIPWDDDIDVIMTRKEYEKFLCVRQQLNKKYVFVSVDTNTDYTAPLAKIYDNTTELHEFGHNDNFILGVYVDIFVFDHISKNKFIRNLTMLRSYFFQKSWGFATYSPKTKSYIEKWLRKVVLFFNLGRKASLCSNYLNKKNKQSGECCSLLYSSYGFEKNIFCVDKIMSVKTVLFEGQEVLSIADADYFLTKVYGNYMKIPPKNERVSNHKFSVFYKNKERNEL